MAKTKSRDHSSIVEHRIWKENLSTSVGFFSFDVNDLNERVGERKRKQIRIRYGTGSRKSC